MSFADAQAIVESLIDPATELTALQKQNWAAPIAMMPVSVEATQATMMQLFECVNDASGALPSQTDAGALLVRTAAKAAQEAIPDKFIGVARAMEDMEAKVESVMTMKNAFKGTVFEELAALDGTVDKLLAQRVAVFGHLASTLGAMKVRIAPAAPVDGSATSVATMQQYLHPTVLCHIKDIVKTYEVQMDKGSHQLGDLYKLMRGDNKDDCFVDMITRVFDTDTKATMRLEKIHLADCRTATTEIKARLEIGKAEACQELANKMLKVPLTVDKGIMIFADKRQAMIKEFVNRYVEEHPEWDEAQVNQADTGWVASVQGASTAITEEKTLLAAENARIVPTEAGKEGTAAAATEQHPTLALLWDTAYKLEAEAGEGSFKPLTTVLEKKMVMAEL